MTQIDPKQIRGYTDLTGQVETNKTEAVSTERVEALFNNTNDEEES